MPVKTNEKGANPPPDNDNTPELTARQSTPFALNAPSTAPPTLESVPVVRWYGVYPAIVRDNNDPDNLGRIRILLAWAPDAGGIVGLDKGQQYETWARLTTFMAGHNRGAWFIPEIDDEVLVAFEGGHPGRPVVVGCLWNGQDTPPNTMDAQRENNVKLLKWVWFPYWSRCHTDSLAKWS